MHRSQKRKEKRDVVDHSAEAFLAGSVFLRRCEISRVTSSCGFGHDVFAARWKVGSKYDIE